MCEKTDSNAITEAFFNFVDAIVHDSMARRELDFAANESGPGLFSRKGAAAYLELGTTTFDKLNKEGKFHPITVHGMKRWAKVDLDRYIRLEMRKS